MPNQLMTESEIHDFGVEVVFQQLRKDGHEILGVNTEPGRDPQIVAKRGNQLEFILVRAACYPNKGVIESEEAFLQAVAHAEANGAMCYFASVGLANASGNDETEMSIPTKGAGFHIAYEGLVVMAKSDRVRVYTRGDA